MPIRPAMRALLLAAAALLIPHLVYAAACTGAGITITDGTGASQCIPGVSPVAPVSSTAAESSHVLKSSAGNLFSVSVTPTVAGYLMVFDATSAPSDGAVTPKFVAAASANATTALAFAPGPPAAFTTGITVVFSTTGAFTKTASATAFFSGLVQ